MSLNAIEKYNTPKEVSFGVFFNLTQHELSKDQLEEIQAKGWAIDKKIDQFLIKELITFDELPNPSIIKERVEKLVLLIKDALVSYRRENDGKRIIAKAMIGGAPFLMGWLENELFQHEIGPLYAFSKREVKETYNEDGSVCKQVVFRHQGFVHPAIR